MKRSKRYLKTVEDRDIEAVYTPAQAMKLVQETATAKFDEMIDISIVLGVDPRKADQNVRGTVVLPHGFGKTPRVIVFAVGDKAKEAMEAGADEVNGEELVEKVEKGYFDFDVAIATPDMMKSVGKLGKYLGRRGLMPNPKAGTVTFDVAKAVKDSKAGKVEFRVDKFGVIHSIIGKKSFELPKLVENYTALIDAIVRAKPASAKGRYLKNIVLSSTMGPGFKVDTTKLRNLLEEIA